MKRKGFTLIELLAVIVILAIIALIAVPIVLNMIENARKSAAKSSAYGYIQAIDDNNELAEMNDDYDTGRTTIQDGTKQVSEITLNIKGKKPTSGSVTIASGKVSSATLCINNYTVTYTAPEVTNVTDGCSGGSTPAVTWDNYITPSQRSGGSTIPSGSTFWIQENTTSGAKEVCGAFPNRTVCFTSENRANEFGRQDENSNYIVTGYALQKKNEMEAAGATECYINDYSVECEYYDEESEAPQNTYVTCEVFDSAEVRCGTSGYSYQCGIDNEDDFAGCN